MSVFDPECLVAALAPFDGVRQVWIAYSGGLDSTVLLRAAAAVRDRLPGALKAVHIDHGLHADSPRWAAHCLATCAGLAIPCTVRSLGLAPAPGESLEAVAREARYGELATLLGPHDLLLTAHNLDDQAETLLLALIRGSGVHGLSAMPAVAELGLGRLVRPLLETRRADLERYARTLGLDWVDDPSNGAVALDRNYLRNLVLPLLRGRWPAVSTTLARTASHCAEAAALVDRMAGETLPGLAGARPGTLSVPGLLRLDTPLCKGVLRLWLRRRGFPVPDSAHLGRVLAEVLTARADADPLVAWRGCEIRRYREDLFAMRPLPAPPPGGEIPWSGPRLDLPHGLGTLERFPERSGAVLGKADLRDLRVRFGVGELVCRPPAGAHGRPLKKLYQEAGIPPWLRPLVPLIFDGEDLVAVAGLCRCEHSAAPQEMPPGPPAPPLPALRWSGHPWESLDFFR